MDMILAAPGLWVRLPESAFTFIAFCVCASVAEILLFIQTLVMCDLGPTLLQYDLVSTIYVSNHPLSK